MLTDSAQKCQGFSGASLFLYWSGFHPVDKIEGLHPDILDKQVLKPTDFTYPDEEGGVYLTETPRRIFLREFEERMNQEVNHPDVQSPVSYRRAIHLQVQRYKRCLLESVPYQSFLRAH